MNSKDKKRLLQAHMMVSAITATNRRPAEIAGTRSTVCWVDEADKLPPIPNLFLLLPQNPNLNLRNRLLSQVSSIVSSANQSLNLTQFLNQQDQQALLLQKQLDQHRLQKLRNGR
jgi:hypothetical protein